MRYLLPPLLLAFLCTPVLSRASADSSRHPALNESVTIGKIRLYGNRKTKDRIVLRELSIREGQAVRSDSLGKLIDENLQRLATISLFTDIRIAIDTVDAANIACDIYLKERWYIIPELAFQLADRNFNVWWTEHDRDLRRVIIGVTLRDKNFRGNLENLSVTAQVGYTQKLSIDYFRPYLDRDQKHGFGASFGFSESQEMYYATDSNKLRFIRTGNEYIIRQYDGGIAYTYRPAYAGRHVLRLTYRNIHIADTVVALNRDYYEDGSRELSMLEFAYRYELNKTDNWNYPLKGTKLIAQLIARVGLQGLRQQAFITLEAGKFHNPAGKWYTSLILRARLSVPEMPPYAFGYALGTKYDYVRGYEYYVIDGSQFGLIRANLKRELLNINIRRIPLRYLPSLPLRIYPKIFADAGYVSNPDPGNSFLNNRVLYSAGFGLDIYTAYDIKVRLEYAWNHLGQKGLFLHFNSE